MLGGESSSSSSNNASSSQWTFHVFLSFRGGDTRLNFTDHLYAALLRKGIITFRDDIQLEKGDVISQELLKAIEQSLASIVVLSQNYASSTWCLAELQKILESRKLHGREVVPVFYGVTPSDVLKLRNDFVEAEQTNGFVEAFKKHETRFEKEKVQTWRDSLIEVAGIPGWESKDKHEGELIENIAASIWTKLRPKLPSYNDGLVGIDSRVKKVDSLLRIEESNQVRFIGIWGMGGRGKTTLARVVFKKLRDQFGTSCFLENVREISGEREGMLSLQSKLLSHLEIKGLEINDVDEGKNTIRNLLFKKKVLLVIDDVDDISQLECLAERQEWFGPGSRVIVTTRDTQVLISHGIVENYEIDILNQYESLQLLSQKAFKRDQPQDNFMELSERVVKYAAGLPLALKLLGTFLCGRSLSQWKEVVEKIKEVPPNDIVKKSLRISYSGLPVRYQTLFLDIACFFKGRVKELVIQALDICERYPPIGIDVLIEKSLATCDDGMHLVMHDLLQEAGRDIVNEECPIDASRRSRLWSIDDINDILKHNKATESIQGLILYPQTKPYEAFWDPEAFSKMRSLKLILILHDIQLPHGIKCLCSSLKFLQWKNFPLESLPLGVSLDEVVELKLRYSKIKKIWSGPQSFAKLKFIDLSFSKDLIQTPIVDWVPCLEILHLEGCINLVEVHQSIGQHKRLVLFNLKDCINLRTFPMKLEMDSLEELILSGCSKVKKLPEFEKNMQCLSVLSLDNCRNLLCLPNSICNLKSLRRLNISGCSKFSSLPNNMDANESLEELDVSGTAIRDITLSKVHLEKLKEVSFGGRKLVASKSRNILQWIMKFRKQPVPMEMTLPPLSHFLVLTSLDLSYCNLNDESFFEGLGTLSLLQELDLRGNNFVNPPAHCISNLSMLESLSFSDCPRLESLPMLPPKVQSLYAADCARMRPLNLDAEMLWQIFEYHMHMELIEEERKVWFIIPGSEIPSWFENQNYHLLIDPSDPPYNELGCDSVASIVVDVHCKWSEWWGIAVCLAFEPINMHVSSPSDLRPGSMGSEEMCFYYWACKAPNREPDSGFPIGPKFGHLVYESNDPYIHIIFLTREHRYIEHYLDGEQSQLELIFYVENLSKPWKPTIRKCGCRVICKEDVQNWRNGSSGELEVEEPISPSAHLLL